jgi:iron complex outermembrane recepter protein
VRQQWVLAEGHSLLLDGALRYSRTRYTDPANTKALQTPSEIYVDAGASYSPPDTQWTFSLRVRNLLDKTYVLIPNVIAPLGVDAAYYNPPRTVLFTARYDF